MRSGTHPESRPDASLTATRADKDSADMADCDSTTGRSPAFQFYPKDFLHDSNVVLMNLAERGAYITLLCYCWSEGSIYDEPTKLAKFCGVSPSVMRRMWTAIAPCFRPADEPGRLIHPRLEREREKQAEFKRRQSDNGRKGGRPAKPTESQNNPSLSSGLTQTEPKKSSSSLSSSSVFNLQSSDSSQKSLAVVPDARSKRPIFKGQRLVVFDWMLDDLARMLGTHTNTFDLHSWFFTLDQQAVDAGTLVPQRDGGRWLQERTLEEAARRGLIPAAEHKSKLTQALEKASRW
jgi:uncharacterized protein YdaU (DUF1376 family)